MNRFAALLALALCLPLAARAVDASLHAKAEEMMALAHADRMSQQVIDTLLQQTTDLATQQSGGSLTAENKATLADFQKKLLGVLEPQIGWDAMKPALADLYAKSFTEDQMDSIIAFYKSPGGAALMEKMPGINQQANEILRTRIVALQPQVRQMFSDLQKSQQVAAPPAPTVPATTPAPKPAPSTPGPQK